VLVALRMAGRSQQLLLVLGLRTVSGCVMVFLNLRAATVVGTSFSE
jgi:hypothetical protein